MRIKVSDYIVQTLSENGVDTVFGYQGGNIVHMIDSIAKSDRVKLVVNYNEQASSFAACAYAYMHETLGVALSSSGPGAVNLISGIANAYFDSLPCLFFTGTVNATAINTNPNVRQSAFQEMDIVSIVRPITKYANTIMGAEDVVQELQKAIQIAMSGRKGPVLLNLPHDVQRAMIEIPDKDAPCLIGNETECAESEVDDDTIKKAQELISGAKRPVLIAGGGVANKRSRALIEAFAAKVSMPVVASLRGLDVLSHEHKCYVGFIGSYGNRYANLAVRHSDLVIALGSRLDCRQIEPSHEAFRDKAVIHVDVDRAELGRTVSESLGIHAGADAFLEKCLRSCEGLDFSNWIGTISRWRERYPSWERHSEETKANFLAHAISGHVRKDVNICADVGQNQMCVAQSVELSHGRRMITSAGLGAMGFSLPAAIGAAFADAHRSVLCFVGDGGIQMNLQELQTIDYLNLPVHIIIFNNHCLGMIRDYQSKVLPERFYGSVSEYSTPDFGLLAQAYHFPFTTVDSEAEYARAVELIESETRSIIEIRLPERMFALPDLGKGMYEQYPYLEEDQQARMMEELEDDI